MLNVAVVEDNDELRDAMVDTLRGRGHRAIGMDSAEAMTDQASGEPIDIVVVDVNLPGEDGFSLTPGCAPSSREPASSWSRAATAEAIARSASRAERTYSSASQFRQRN